MRLFICFMLLLIFGSEAYAQTKMWVTSDRLNRRTCPSQECGIVGKLFYREAATVLETANGWGRISRYYDASCLGGRSEYVESGNQACVASNGISGGKFAEWVALDYLATVRPPSPAENTSGTANLVARSDDFRLHRAAFVKAATMLMEAGQCTAGDFREQGGWIKSSSKGSSIYFTYCQNGTDRIYLDVSSGRTFR